MIDDEEDFFYDGLIPGQPKEDDYMKEYMLSTVSSIKEDIIMNFPQEESEFYVYTKYSEKDKTLKIFVCLLKETKINNREMNINFLIIINEEFPNKPPMVFCLTDVNIYIIYLFHIFSS
jgi:hypothetical protein